MTRRAQANALLTLTVVAIAFSPGRPGLALLAIGLVVVGAVVHRQAHVERDALLDAARHNDDHSLTLLQRERAQSAINEHEARGERLARVFGGESNA